MRRPGDELLCAVLEQPVPRSVPASSSASATFPASLDTGGLCFDSITTPVYGCEDDLQQLAMLKDAMRQQLELVEARLAELRPQSVEEIDQLKARLLEAVAELDERREQQS